MVSQTKTAGRPREFDLDQALEAAIEVFWRRGFEGTSLSDLTTAMELSRPSVYAAFGNKEALFRKALARYAETRTAAMDAALRAPLVKDAVRALPARVRRVGHRSGHATRMPDGPGRRHPGRIGSGDPRRAGQGTPRRSRSPNVAATAGHRRAGPARRLRSRRPRPLRHHPHPGHRGPGRQRRHAAPAGPRHRPRSGRLAALTGRPRHERADVTASNGVAAGMAAASTRLGRSCRGCARTR